MLYFFLGSAYLKHLTNVFAVFSFLFFTGSVAVHWKHFGHFPSYSLGDLFAMLSLSLMLIYLLLYLKFRRPLLGMFIFPIVIALSVFTLILPSSAPKADGIESVWLFIHLPFTIIGTTFFMFATVSSVMYFVQERQLKKKNFGVIFRRFPPLDQINRLTSLTLVSGFYFFSIGLMSGIVWMFYDQGRVTFFTPKMFFAIITWIIFAIITYFKEYRGMSPRSTAYSTLTGFISVVVTYIGVAYFLMG
jgi:ABC-type uncharacterized transport system permease subunit